MAECAKATIETKMSPPTSTKLENAVSGVNQSNVRAHNERLVLTLVRRHGSLPASEIAQRSGLSPQTVSVIIRALVADGLLLKGKPQRGKVGQPSVPLQLNHNGVYSIGLKIGRRSAELVLLNFVGERKKLIRHTYSYPMPDALLNFVEREMANLLADLDVEQVNHIAGIGLSMPFELWNWKDKVGAPEGEMDVWREDNFAERLNVLTQYPVIVKNDATSACSAELLLGQGANLNDFIYFFIGTFIGGGVVLNNSVYPGRTGYAGALSPMLVTGPDGKPSSLIDCASIYTLELMLRENDIDCTPLWSSPDDWSMFGKELDDWIESTGNYLAHAAVSSCSVIDFEAVVVGGACPVSVKTRLIASMDAALNKIDLQGLNKPKIIQGTVGSDARSLGAALQPITARYLIDQNLLISQAHPLN